MKRTFDIEHMRVTVSKSEESGATFSVRVQDDSKPALFTGFVRKGMALELLLLADHISELEKGL